MKKIAFIPIRSGSKGIKDKNIKEFNGKPLCYWTIRSSSESKSINEVYVSTDSKKIIDIVESFQLPKVKTFLRSKKTSLDTSSTESAMLEFIEKMNFDEESIFILIQATSPFTKAEDIDLGLRPYRLRTRNWKPDDRYLHDEAIKLAKDSRQKVQEYSEKISI